MYSIYEIGENYFAAVLRLNLILIFESFAGETQRLIGKYENSNDSRITCVEWLNSHDDSLVMIGSDDGSIRVWKPDYEKGKPK